MTALRQPTHRQSFGRSFAQHNRFQELDTGNIVEDNWNAIEAAFGVSAATLPDVQHIARKPWISQTTLELLEKRTAARLSCDRIAEREIQKAIRKAAKQDKGNWLDEVVADGSWRGIKRLRKPLAAKQGRMKNKDGELVYSSERADAMAEFLETTQWRVRSATTVQNQTSSNPLPVRLDAFSLDEVRRILRNLNNNNNNKVPGPDGIAP